MREVFIPPKKDKLGKRFGFVRFVDVQDQRILEEHLQDVWIGTYKLRVNIPRFERGNVKCAPSWQKAPIATV